MKLSVILSNRNDIVMFNVTLCSIIEALKSLNCETEIVVAENSDDYLHNLILSSFPALLKYSVRLIRNTRPSLAKSRMLAAEASTGKYIFCLDSHALIGHDTFKDSINFMDSAPANIGFAHPPMRWARDGVNQLRQSVKPSPEGSPYVRLMPGKWKSNRKMFWKPMPWICNRDWYLNVLKGYGAHSDAELSWGGGDILQQIKSWMLGYEQWYIHTDPVIHIGPYKRAVYNTGQYRYENYKKDVNFPTGFGILLSIYVLAGEEEGYRLATVMKSRLMKIHKLSVDSVWSEVVKVGKPEHEWLVKHRVISYEDLIATKPWNN